MSQRHFAKMICGVTIAICLSIGSQAGAQSKPHTSPLKTRDEALRIFGHPSMRQPLADGGERLRWIKADQSLLARLDVVTIDINGGGDVQRVRKETMRSLDRSQP
jgi:hypothetical protein